VSSSLAGIDRGAACSHAFETGTAVTLTATPAAGSTFAGWSGGGCSGTGACTVTMISDQTVTATFSPSGSPLVVLSALAVSPGRFALAGRLVKGRCVPATRKSRNRRRCTRRIRLRISYQLNLRISYPLTGLARVTITLARILPGRLSKGRCVKPTANNRHGRRCTLLVGVAGALTASARQGANTFTINGRIGGHRLKPGSYRLTATPTAGGLTGTPDTTTFQLTS
jgi:Divergent InlB B-repeat domain